MVVRRRIEAAGADPSSVRIVAVTKGFPSAAVSAALANGLVDVGENYAQELLTKANDPDVVGPYGGPSGRTASGVASLAFPRGGPAQQGAAVGPVGALLAGGGPAGRGGRDRSTPTGCRDPRGGRHHGGSSAARLPARGRPGVGGRYPGFGGRSPGLDDGGADREGRRSEVLRGRAGAGGSPGPARALDGYERRHGVRSSGGIDNGPPGSGAFRFRPAIDVPPGRLTTQYA